MRARQSAVPLVLIFLCFALSPAAFPNSPQTTAPAQAAGPQEKTPSPDKPDYSQEAFVFEQFYVRARFEKDGTGERETSIRVRVQSDAGVQALGQLIFGYNSGNEQLDIVYVRVLKSDGTTVSAGADAVQDLTAPIAREAPVYTDFRQKHVTVPGLRPGETLEYKIVHRVQTPLAPGHFWFEHDFVEGPIVLDEQLVVNVPVESKLKLKTETGADPEIREEKGRRIYTWKHTNLKREEDDENAPKKKKKRRKHETPAVQLTTFQSWEEVGRWYAGLERERAMPDNSVRAKAAELVTGRTSEVEKLRAIYDYVAKNFRYVSLSFGVGRYQPHAAAEVFANQYGDCKDKHTLLAAMAQAAGLRASPVLINSSRKLDPDVPSPSQFDHVISAVSLGNEILWLDTTTEVAPFRLLAASLRNKQALLVPDDGTPRVVTTPADPPFPATQHVEIEGTVSELGKLSAKVSYTLRGDSELLLRSAFRRTPRNQWKQLAQVIAYSDGLRGEVTEVNASDPAATEEPFRLEYQFGQAGFLDWSSKKAQVGLPLPSVGLPDAEVDDEEDAEPIELGTPLDVRMTLKLTVPERYAARAPIAVGLKRDYAEYSSTYKLEGKTVSVQRALRFMQRELPAARARDYQAFTRAIRADEGQPLSVESSVAGTPTIPETAKAEELLQAAGAAARSENYRMAAELLQRVVALEPKHRNAWGLLGSMNFALQNYEAAAGAFLKQSEVNPYDENAYTLLGMTRWRQQKYDDAAAAFRKQMEVTPLNKQAQASLAQMLVEWRKYDEAVPELEKAIVLTPDDPSLHVSLGRAYLNQGKGEAALAAFDKGVELAPEPTTWNNVAYYLSLHQISLDRAQQYAESAVASVAAELRNVSLDRLTTRDLGRVSSLAAYWDTLGWVHFQRGSLEKAEKYVTASWLLDLHGEVGDHLGQIQEKRGQKELAARTYALALLASRPVPETRERLAKLAGGAGKIDAQVDAARGPAAGLRLVKLGALWKNEKEEARAEFYVLVSPGADGQPRVEAVKFIRGSEKLRSLASALEKATYPVLFPDSTQTRIVRRGELVCLAGKACVLGLFAADAVTSAN